MLYCNYIVDHGLFPHFQMHQDAMRKSEENARKEKLEAKTQMDATDGFFMTESGLCLSL